MSLKDLYNHILTGLGITALVVVMSGAASTIVPLSKYNEVSSVASSSKKAATISAPQCKIKNNFFGIPRCEQPASESSKNQLH